MSNLIRNGVLGLVLLINMTIIKADTSMTNEVLLMSDIYDMSKEELISRVNSLDYIYRYIAHDYKRRDLRWPFQSKYTDTVRYTLERPNTKTCRILDEEQCQEFMLRTVLYFSALSNCVYDLEQKKMNFRWNIENGATVFTDCEKIPNPMKGRYTK